MYLIVGLGNPNREYNGTRHNIGFNAIDVLADKYNISVSESKHKALIGKGYIGREKVILVKPQTYMNLSGESVREIVEYYKLDVNDRLVVLCDDINLPVGQLRIRKKGSEGGHNGLRNIIWLLKTEDFVRIRIGVGSKPEVMDLADYVLSRFLEEERTIMIGCISKAVEAIELIIDDKIDKAMNIYNKRKEVKDENGSI